jgi:hypothetical protein
MPFKESTIMNLNNENPQAMVQDWFGVYSAYSIQLFYDNYDICVVMLSSLCIIAPSSNYRLLFDLILDYEVPKNIYNKQ